ncbi:MAG: hypothetical protein IT370_19700 [Deltaproteobacteria bacterium]|nr:hypothetical protein [Deltaproteobacteria bacterium]
MKIGPVLMLVGGGAAAASPFLPWITVMNQSANFIGTSDGKAILGCGVVVAALGLLALMGKGVPKASLMIVGILAGLGAAGLAGYDYNKIRGLVSGSHGAASVGFGAYLGMIGGVLGVIGSVLKPKPQG